MLWVLKRTVSSRRFFWVPKTHVKTNGQEIILKNHAQKCCIPGPMLYK